jgi:hypothetical protein
MKTPVVNLSPVFPPDKEPVTPVYAVLILNEYWQRPSFEEVPELDTVLNCTTYVPKEYSLEGAIARCRNLEKEGFTARARHSGWKQRGFRPGEKRLPDAYKTA